MFKTFSWWAQFYAALVGEAARAALKVKAK